MYGYSCSLPIGTLDSLSEPSIRPLEAQIATYLATLDNVRPEEMFETQREYARQELEAFVQWLRRSPERTSDGLLADR